jgi:muramoyltetrapeptide carboxypeptidase LdcA involved in peptidoglycan recycling
MLSRRTKVEEPSGLPRIGLAKSNWSTPMKFAHIAAVALAISVGWFSAADAKGCIKGAIVGGVAGHMAGHGKLGAAAGCAIGHHEANKPDPNNANAQAPASK